MIDFWIAHGWWFILFMFFFPRLTMMFGTAVCWAGGPLFWFGWIFLPRLTVAIIATGTYWDSNPVLVVFTWLWALSSGGAHSSTAKKYRVKHDTKRD